MMVNLPPRPRWGTFSVRAHLDLAALTRDVLLFDALLLPTPADEQEYSRWAGRGWQPDLLATRVVQLGDQVFPVPWTERLREQWGDRYERMKQAGRPDEDLPYTLTETVIADQFWDKLVDPEDDRIKALQRTPELVAAYQRRSQAYGDLQTRALAGPTWFTETDVGVVFEWKLGLPAEVTEDTFLRAVDLARDEAFGASRVALYDWASEIAGEQKRYTVEQAAHEMERLVDRYNGLAAQRLRDTKLRSVLYIVPVGLGVALDQLVGGWAKTVLGAAAGVAVDVVKARFPRLSDKAESLSHEPGAAVARALSVLASG